MIWSDDPVESSRCEDQDDFDEEEAIQQMERSYEAYIGRT